MIRKTTYFVFLISYISSCSNEDMEIGMRTNFPLTSGSYWIYRTTITSADGVVEIFPYLDSVWIEKDTVINSKNYWMQIGTLSGTIYLRDSADCVIMRQLTFEQIIYSTNRDTLQSNPPAYKVITDINAVTEVPAGKFRTINCRTLLRRDPLNTTHDSDYPRYDKNFYTAEQYICSKDIGLIKNVYYYLGGTIEYELIRYKLF